MNIFKFETKRLLKSAAIWGIINGGLVFLFMLFFPSMENSGIQSLIEAELDAFPEGFLEAFGIDLGIDFTNISEYLAYTVQYIAMAAGVYGAILGVNSLIKEESEGTIEFLYSQPVKRSTIVTAKIGSNALIYGIFLSILWVITVIACLSVKPEDTAVRELIVDITTMVGGIAIIGYVFMAIGILLSTVVKSSKKAVPLAISIFFISFLIGILGKLKENLENLKYLSPFEYAAPSDVIANGIDLVNFSLSVIIIIISISTAYYIYQKKDMKI